MEIIEHTRQKLSLQSQPYNKVFRKILRLNLIIIPLIILSVNILFLAKFARKQVLECEKTGIETLEPIKIKCKFATSGLIKKTEILTFNELKEVRIEKKQTFSGYQGQNIYINTEKGELLLLSIIAKNDATESRINNFINNNIDIGLFISTDSTKIYWPTLIILSLATFIALLIPLLLLGYIFPFKYTLNFDKIIGKLTITREGLLKTWQQEYNLTEIIAINTQETTLKYNQKITSIYLLLSSEKKIIFPLICYYASNNMFKPLSPEENQQSVLKDYQIIKEFLQLY